MKPNQPQIKPKSNQIHLKSNTNQIKPHQNQTEIKQGAKIQPKPSRTQSEILRNAIKTIGNPNGIIVKSYENHKKS